MRCPKCGSDNNRVLDTRYVWGDNKNVYQRRRHCFACGHRSSSYEFLEPVGFKIVTYKKDIVKYDRTAYYNKIMIFCTPLKGKLTKSRINKLLTNIEEIHFKGRDSVTEKEMDTAIISEMLKFDPSGAIRYLNRHAKSYLKK